jgi:hemolysin D
LSAYLRILAVADLGARYLRAFSHHWRERNLQGHRRYTAKEADFLPSALALIERPVSPTARVTGVLLSVLVFSLVVWSVLAHVDIVVTAAGKVIPGGWTKSIESVDVASVRAIRVTEGQKVRAGDVLLELDAGVFEADARKAEVDIRAARLEIARARALITAIDTHRPPVLAPVPGVLRADFDEARSNLLGQYREYRARLTELEGEIARYSQALPLAQERARNFEVLARTHDVSTNSTSEKLQAVIDLQGQLDQALDSRDSLIAQTRRKALDSLTDASKVVSSATQDAARAMSHARLLILRSPVDGVVQQLAVHTIGGVVPAAQPLMMIVPDEKRIRIEAYVQNKDVGFVAKGQPAAVKVAAFDYTKYGMVSGRIELISRDAIEDEKKGLLYRTEIGVDRNTMRIDGRDRVLEPGMEVDVEIKTGTRRLIEYVLSPLLRHEHESLNER